MRSQTNRVTPASTVSCSSAPRLRRNPLGDAGFEMPFGVDQCVGRTSRSRLSFVGSNRESGNEGASSQPEYTLAKPSNCSNNREHVTATSLETDAT